MKLVDVVVGAGQRETEAAVSLSPCWMAAEAVSSVRDVPIGSMTDNLLMEEHPAVVQRDAQPYIGVRGSVTMQEIPVIADRIGELFGFLQQRGSTPAGPPFLKYNVIDMAGLLVIEAGIPVVQPPDAEGDIFGATLPAGRFATVVHHGHPDELEGVTAELLGWAEREGLAWDRSEGPDGEHWGCRLENYLTEPSAPMSDWDTQLAFRLKDQPKSDSSEAS